MIEQINQQTYAKPHAKENQCRQLPTTAKLWFYLILIIMEENTNRYADHDGDEEYPQQSEREFRFLSNRSTHLLFHSSNWVLF